MTTSGAMLEHALGYAANGWRPFPCRESGENAKAPYWSKGDLENGHLDATQDAALIVEWWTRWPCALIGAPVPDPLIVVDLDPRKGGTYQALVAAIGNLPETLTGWSGRNDDGRHLYFLKPPGELTSIRLPKGIDLKVGGRGYCIMPPSLHPATGLPYWWEEHEIVALPNALRELLRVPYRPRVTTSSHGDGSQLIRFVTAMTDGERNSGLFWAACRAAEKGILGALEAELVSAALGAGLSEREARRTIASAARRPGVAR